LAQNIVLLWDHAIHYEAPEETEDALRFEMVAFDTLDEAMALWEEPILESSYGNRDQESNTSQANGQQKKNYRSAILYLQGCDCVF